MQGLTLNRSDSLLLVNCHDRVIRMFEVLPVSRLPEHPLQGMDEKEVDAYLAQVRRPPRSGEKATYTLVSHQTVPDLRILISLLTLPTLPAPPAQPHTPALLVHVRDFQNVVERCSWRSACFSSDSEHVIGASAGKAVHHLYIWNRITGNMERILEGVNIGMDMLALKRL